MKLGSFAFKPLGMNGFRLATWSMILEPAPLPPLAEDSGRLTICPPPLEESGIFAALSDMVVD